MVDLSAFYDETTGRIYVRALAGTVIGGVLLAIANGLASVPLRVSRWVSAYLDALEAGQLRLIGESIGSFDAIVRQSWLEALPFIASGGALSWALAMVIVMLTFTVLGWLLAKGWSLLG